MRLLPSPSTSSSSTSTHFDVKMCTSRSATASWFAGILRGFLCSCSLPTRPSDQITKTSPVGRENKHQVPSHSNEEIEASSATTPGVVARLMGLASLPDINTADMQVSAGSVPRSRSMNSVEFRGEWDQNQGNYGGTKNTLSLREENEEFFVLSFEKECRGKKVMSKGGKFEVGCKELRQKRGEKCRNEENRRKKVALGKKEDKEVIKKMILTVVDQEESSRKQIPEFEKIEDTCEQPSVAVEEAEKSNRTSHEGDFDRTTLRKQRKKVNGPIAIKNEELKSSSEDSSPVSVLDFGHFIIDSEASTSEENTNPGESNSRRKLMPEFVNHNCLFQHGAGCLIGDDRNSRRRVGQGQDHIDIDMWGEIVRLAGSQVVKSNWKHNNAWEFKDFEDISGDFGFQILDELLGEMVDQLSWHDMKKIEPVTL